MGYAEPEIPVNSPRVLGGLKQPQHGETGLSIAKEFKEMKKQEKGGRDPGR